VVEPEARPAVVTVGGSDSSGGAGIQADLKTIHALGGYGLSVLTSVTAQNSDGILAVQHLPGRLVEAQLRALADDFPVAAIKTGMLATAEVVIALAEFLTEFLVNAPRRQAGREVPLVVDPVLKSTSGHALLDDQGKKMLIERLLPLATVCTPNWPEAEFLGGIPVGNLDDAVEAAQRIVAKGTRAVVVTGGHGSGETSVDVLVGRDGIARFSSRRMAGSFHGTGCAFAAALATGLAAGQPVAEAVERAKQYVSRAIISPLLLGQRRPILDHLGGRPPE